MNSQGAVNSVIENNKEKIYGKWLEKIKENGLLKKGFSSQNELNETTQKIFNAFLQMLEIDSVIRIEAVNYDEIRKPLEHFSKLMAVRGLSPTETSMFIYSLKGVVLEEVYGGNSEILNTQIIMLTDTLDKMGLYTFDFFVKGREEVILRQQQDMMELSTPVIRVWEGILTVPLIGTLDSRRTQLVMEKLLEIIISTNARVTIVDITGVPTVDTLVANHLLKTASATRLLGAEMIITGISPVIAQTMVHLGVDISSVTTRALMADGIKLALEMLDCRIVKVKKTL